MLCLELENILEYDDIRHLDQAPIYQKILQRSLAATTLAVASHVINAICIAFIHIFIYIELLLSTCTLYALTYNTSCRYVPMCKDEYSCVRGDP